jgi:hypothetical protein
VKLSDLRFHFTPKSANVKTGPIPVSTSSSVTCPSTCPFKGNGCYAESGPLALHWREVTAGNRGTDAAGFFDSISKLPIGQLWRHNQAGDLPHTLGRISRRFIKSIVEANKGRRGFTYTHHDITKGENLALVRYANRNGFRVNVSTESEAAADRAVLAGLPAVIAVPSTETRTHWRTPAGHVVTVCPAQRKEDQFSGVSCSSCQLCQTRDHRQIIAFIVHGTSKKRADAAIATA